ncbi:MAG TPA: hypothetical protein VLI06_11935 [Solimonas sp.]|nr:hypothetical protein [Solimonas sp.]
MDITEKVRDWHIPLSSGSRRLGEVHAELQGFALRQDDIPFLIQLVENPKYDLPGFTLFHGAADLWVHDQIHILLGRGLLAKDEAFVIGYTMGTTARVGQTEEWLYGLLAKYLYPREYRFSEQDMEVFRDAVRLGFISRCHALAEADFRALQDLTIAEARQRLNIEEDLLRAYYAIEQRRFPDSFESARLLA